MELIIDNPEIIVINLKTLLYVIGRISEEQ